MKHFFKIVPTFCISLLLCASLQAQITFPAFISDGMVLQQQSHALLWGKAAPRSVISAVTSWNGAEYAVRADQSGNWKINVSTPAAGGPYSVVFKSGNENIILRDILIGEVWLCSGQSNMEMPMKGFRNQPVKNSGTDILKSSNPKIRLFTVKRNSTLDVQDDVHGEWFSANPASVREFSATAYYYGRLLNEILNVPIGLICTSWGGSRVESWMDKGMLKPFPDVKLPKSETDIKEKNRTPTTLYNGMIAPLVGYSVRGVIWYQGETNYDRHMSYKELFKTMVAGWRAKWGLGDFPFYYCQIAPYDYALVTTKDREVVNSAYLREAQLQAESEIENSGMAVLLDVGAEKGIHPPDKQTVGERLALHALSKTYRIEGIVADSPIYKELSVRGDTAILSFERADMWLTSPEGELKNFEIAGEDKKFHKAEAWISRSNICVKSDAVSRPVAVRYAFKNYSEGDLFGTEGLPVSSFRTDNW